MEIDLPLPNSEKQRE